MARNQKRKRTPTRRRVTRGRPTPKRSAPPSAPSAGVVPVLLAVASSAARVKVDTSLFPPETTPKNLLQLRFNDRRVGISTPAQLAAWRNNLAVLVPEAAGAVRTLTPASTIADAAAIVGRHLAARPQEERAPTVIVPGRVAQARQQIENRWGKAFASKSSSRLLERLTAPARGALEAVSAPAPLVVECVWPEALPLSPERAASRTQRIGAARDAFYRLVSPLRAAIETASGVAGVQLCWLNATMRVAGQIAAVAAVADDPAMQLLDVSGTLRREMDVAAGTVHVSFPRSTLGLTGTGVRVAVIDGEVNVGHAAFGGRATLQENLTNEPFGRPDVHGTAVAGIIGAADATSGGIAPGVTMLNYKVFPFGSVEGDEFQGMLAVEHALRDGADVANCSWGTGELAGDGTGRNALAFNTAWEHGLILIKSAGNFGPDPGSMTAPADANGVIVVGATDRAGASVQNYSSRGPSPNGKHPHLVVPGGTKVDRMSSCLADAPGFGRREFGTSVAAPIVTGAVALLRERFSGETADQIRERLLGMCQPLGGDVNASGAGLLDLSSFP
jgi:serine protease AprX